MSAIFPKGGGAFFSLKSNVKVFALYLVYWNGLNVFDLFSK